MARVYVETSFISALVTDRTDPGSVVRRETSLQWWARFRQHHQLFASAEVIQELDDPAFRGREEALRLAAEADLLQIDDEVVGFAAILVKEKVMPGPVAGDAIHVAVAATYRMDYLLSWNVRHLANPSKLVHLGTICLRLGLVPPRIVTPDLLWEAPP